MPVRSITSGLHVPSILLSMHCSLLVFNGVTVGFLFVPKIMAYRTGIQVGSLLFFSFSPPFCSCYCLRGLSVISSCLLF